MYDNKLFVVIGVIALIFTGIIIYLFSIDRKVNKLRKEQEKRKNNTP